MRDLASPNSIESQSTNGRGTIYRTVEHGQWIAVVDLSLICRTATKNGTTFLALLEEKRLSRQTDWRIPVQREQQQRLMMIIGTQTPGRQNSRKRATAAGTLPAQNIWMSRSASCYPHQRGT